MPTCVDGNLARFQTRVSHYLQTADIDLESNFEDSIGVLEGDSAIAFHGSYDGGGYLIEGLKTTSNGGLFAVVGAAAVIEKVHLREVDANGGETGAIVNVLQRSFNRYVERLRYSSLRKRTLILPYYDFHFGSLWNRLDYREGDLTKPKLLQSSVTGSVRGTQNAGGLVGLAEGADILGNYSAATVEAIRSAGGLVGRADEYGFGFDPLRSAIEDSLATGNVRGGEYVGGVVGRSESFAQRNIATGVPSALEGTNPPLGALVGELFRYGFMADSLGLGSDKLLGASAAELVFGTPHRVYGASSGTETFSCSNSPFHWTSEEHGAYIDTCASYTAEGGLEADFAWDFGTASEYPVPSYNVLTPAEIRALIPSPIPSP